MPARVASTVGRLLSTPLLRRGRIVLTGVVLALGCGAVSVQAHVPLTAALSIKAGYGHTCVLTSAGGVKCWARNEYGQVGYGDTALHTTPVDVSGLTSGVAAIATGWYHTCALTFGGGVKCWGHNGRGQLGDESTTDHWTPVNVSGLTSGVAAIAAGAEHTCALLSLGGGVKCWGYNNYGQLGDGVTTDSSIPINVDGLASGVIAITAGSLHTCALTFGGGVKCWGSNSDGQLGLGNYVVHKTPTDVPMLSSGVRAIAAGYFHTCALTSSGEAKCWGNNNYGQVGDGVFDVSDRLAPVTVFGLTSGVTSIAGGYQHTCAVVYGGAKCWGYNGAGQQGTNQPANVFHIAPADVYHFATGARQITAGYEHTCALIDGGGARCWGRDGTGFVGWVPYAVMVDANSTAPPLFTSFGRPPSAGCGGDPVCTATGNWFHEHTDLRLPGRGLGFAFTRSYNARSDYTGPMGLGWTHAYNLSLFEDANNGSVVLTYGDGHQAYFDPAGGGNYTSRYPGVYDRLVKSTQFTLIAKDQTQYRFSLAGVLTFIADPNGNTLQFAYADGRLTGITDTVGRLITLAYNADGRLASVTDPAPRTVSYTYDASGNLATAVDPRGFTTTYLYDGFHRLTQIMDRRGNSQVANAYDVAGRVTSQTNGRGFTTTFAYDTPVVGDTSIADPLGHVSVHTHDAQYRLLVTRDGLGHETEYTYDASNNRIAVEDKNDKTTTFTYDARGNPTSATDPLGKVTTAVYDARDKPTQRTDAAGKTIAFAYDANGNLTTITDPLAGVTQFAYDAHGQPTTITNARGKTWTRTYDASGNLIEIKDPLNAVTHYASDAVGRMTSRTDALGHITSFTYDAADSLLSITLPLGQVTGFAYDGNGNRTSVTDARGTVTRFAYDENNLLAQVTDGLGGLIDLNYDGANHRTGVIDQRGNATAFAYDAAGRTVSRTNALGQVTQYAYDGNGNLLTLTNPLGKATHYAYDAVDRQTSVTDAAGNLTLAAYDTMGRLTSVTDANGHTTTYAYDAIGRLVKVTDAIGGTATYGYDAVGNRIQVNDPKNMGVTYGYTAVDQLQTRAAPLGDVYGYGYDAAGRRINRTDAKGATTTYAHDANGRLVSIAYPDLSLVTFGYDEVGNRVAVSDGLGTTSYEYDVLNRIKRTTDPFGNVVDYTYDAAGNRKTVGYPGAKQVTYAYDDLNRMATVSDWLGGTTHYIYDAAGNLETSLLPNGAMVDYVYDDAQRLTALVNARPDTSFIAGYLLDLDGVGNRVQITPQGPLAPVLADATTGYTYDALNRLTSLNGNPATSDANGNQTALSGVNYAYDVEDRLISAAGGAAQYRYDGMGNRREATRSSVVTRYVLDVAGPMSNVLLETDASDNPTAYYVHGLGLTSRITPSGDASYYHYDATGSTVALTDAAANVTDRYAYDPFGVLTNQQGTTLNPFRYVGRYGVMDESNGLNFVRARYYNSGNGRFITQDILPSNAAGTQAMHRFSYALNNPIRYVDVNGLEWDCPSIANPATRRACEEEVQQRAEFRRREDERPPWLKEVDAITNFLMFAGECALGPLGCMIDQGCEDAPDPIDCQARTYWLQVALMFVEPGMSARTVRVFKKEFLEELAKDAFSKYLMWSSCNQ